MATSDLIRLDDLKRLLHYDPETGVFTRAVEKHGIPAGTVVGSDDGEGYLKVSLNGQTYKCHRLAWFYVTGKWPEHKIDHENGVRYDNRFDNLRDATQRVNLQNQRLAKSNNKSTGVLGVSKHGRRFKAAIGINGEQIVLGRFDNLADAQALYLWHKRFWHEGCTV